jgi:hypothetical protein
MGVGQPPQRAFTGQPLEEKIINNRKKKKKMRLKGNKGTKCKKIIYTNKGSTEKRDVITKTCFLPLYVLP